MDIYQFFSCSTAIPIRIDSIAGFLTDSGFANRIYFCEVDIDPDIMWAQLRAYKQRFAYGDEFTEYEIQYSKRLTDAQKRLACCKELLHILDEENQIAASQEAVETLIQQMSIPPQSGISLPAANDHLGIVRALLVLVPRDCLVKFKTAYDAGDITADEVAKATGIPVEFARLTLQDFWQDLANSIT